ncbi:MAG: amino-acid N-acetyltransferase [Kangiellaceae bacterium]|nr:amino-acid N-acetyltransferase [Kangiellaceae bacterium]
MQKETSPDNASDPILDWFRNSSSYINAHRGKVVVISMPGECIDSPHFATHLQDIALMMTLGIRVVLVYGCRPQIDRALDKAGIAPLWSGGRRITQEQDMPHLINAVNHVRSTVENTLAILRPNVVGKSQPLRFVSGNYLIAKPIGIMGGTDYQHTGLIRRIDTEGIRYQLEAGNLVVINHLAPSPVGDIFNLESTVIASELAVALNSDKLIYFLNNPHANDAEGHDLSFIDRDVDATDLSADSDTKRSNSYLALAKESCQRGVHRVHLIDYQKEGALLLELFTLDGSGILISDSYFERLRQASIEDVQGILSLIKPLEEKGILVPRSRELIENNISNYIVIERDGLIIACASFEAFSQSNMAELSCLAVSPDYRGGARGEQLLAQIIENARNKGLNTLFILTTQSAHWFRERGFKPAPLENLPDKRQQSYNPERNSKLFVRTLA